MSAKSTGSTVRRRSLLLLLLLPMMMGGPAFGQDTIEIAHQPPAFAKPGTDVEVRVYANSTCGDEVVDTRHESGTRYDWTGQSYPWRRVTADADLECQDPQLSVAVWVDQYQTRTVGQVTMTASTRPDWDFEGSVVIPGAEVTGTQLRYLASVSQTNQGACASAGYTGPWTFAGCSRLLIPPVTSPIGPSATTCNYNAYQSQSYTVPLSTTDPKPSPSASPTQKGRKPK